MKIPTLNYFFDLIFTCSLNIVYTKMTFFTTRQMQKYFRLKSSASKKVTFLS